jgi:hypothetical protein
MGVTRTHAGCSTMFLTAADIAFARAKVLATHAGLMGHRSVMRHCTECTGWDTSTMEFHSHALTRFALCRASPSGPKLDSSAAATTAGLVVGLAISTFPSEEAVVCDAIWMLMVLSHPSLSLRCYCDVTESPLVEQLDRVGCLDHFHKLTLRLLARVVEARRACARPCHGSCNA